MCNMKRVNIALIILAALFTASCTDFDNNLSEAEIRYNQNFIDQFGNIDPNQDWNMAQQVTANLDLSGIRGKATVKIFEADPLATVNAKYLSYIDVTNGVANWKFDAPKSAKELFVHVMQNGVRLYGGYCNVEQGTMSISEGSLHKKTSAKATRAMGTGVGELLWTEMIWDGEEFSDYVIFANYNQVRMCQQFQIKNIDGADRILYTPDITTTEFKVLKYNNNDNTAYDFNTNFLYFEDGTEAFDQSYNLSYYFNNTGSSLKFSDTAVKSKKLHMARTYAISADTKTDDDTRWLIGDCKDLFWTGDAPFKESEDYRSQKHLDLYTAHGTNLAEIEEKGVLFTTSKEDAEIDIPMMYGATQESDALGYYYYDPKTQDPRDVNRYMLFADARPTTNIKVNGVNVPDGMTLQSQGSYKDEDVVSCTTRHLMYFGPNGEDAGTTKFPKGLKIGFFTRYQTTPYRSITPASPGGETGYAYSTAKMNKEHFYVPALSSAGDAKYTDNHGFWDYRGSKAESGLGISKDETRGNVKAITWNYGGRVLVGFGDDTGDCDLNDFVFWVNGDIEEKPKVNIETKTKDDAYEWIVACEDLGSTDDYDFNDVVFGIKHHTKTTTLYTSFYDNDNTLITKVPEVVDKENYLVVTPYAAGGVLKSNIFYKERNLGEIHSLLNLSEKATYDATASGKMPMLNTTSRTYEGHPVVIELDEDEDFSITADKGTTNISNFKVKVTSANGILSNAEEAVVIEAPDDGTVPQMIVVPCGWDWPTERTDIKSAYPDFRDWVSDAKLSDWDAVKVNGSFITNPYKTASTPGTGGNATPPQPDVTPSGTTTYTGDALAALLDNGTYVIPASACQTKTRCTVTFTFTTADDKYVEMDATNSTWVALFANPAWQQTYTISNVEPGQEYPFEVLTTLNSNINTNGMKFSTNHGTITSIKIVAE